MKIKEVIHEISVGFALFFSSFYIFLLLPQIYGMAGIEQQDVVVSLSLIIIISTLISFFFTRMPLIIAPGISISSYIVFTLFLDKGLSWNTILAAVFIEGIIFFALTISKLREWFSLGIPNSFKYGILVGAGLFLISIGLNNSYLGKGDVFSVPSVITIASIIFGFLLISRKVPGTFFLVIMFSFILFYFAGYVTLPSRVFEMPSLKVYELDFSSLSKAGLLSIVLSLLMIDFFDGLGVSTSLLVRKGHLSKSGKIKGLAELMKLDSLTTMVSSFLGMGSSVIMLESGIALHENIKTIIPQLIVILLSLAVMFFSPLVNSFNLAISSPVLIILGLLFFSSVKMENFKKYDELLPSLLTAVLIPFTMSFSIGIAIGSISYVVLKLLLGKIKEVSPAMAIIALLFFLDFLYIFNA